VKENEHSVPREGKANALQKNLSVLKEFVEELIFILSNE